jgi:hypothetical protein
MVEKLKNSEKKLNTIIPAEIITQRIFFIRGQKVMLDADLAELYGIKTMVLNQTVKRNVARFPSDFMFQLNDIEKQEVITNCDNLRKLKYSSNLPHAFTEHGVAMLSSVLRSPRAVQMNILIVRAFIKIREILASNKDLAYQVEELQREQKLQNKHINSIYSLIDKLIEEPKKHENKIGFRR